MQKYNTDHATDNHSSTRDAAINLGAKGIPVFPCGERKNPLTRRGFKDATTDPKVIWQMWERYRYVPCLGVPTGEASGLLVIDVDVDDGKQGEESLAHLEETYEPLLTRRKVRTWTQRSKSEPRNARLRNRRWWRTRVEAMVD